MLSPATTTDAAAMTCIDPERCWQDRDNYNWVRDAGKVLAGKVGHYIFISTISVYAANDTPGADKSISATHISTCRGDIEVL